MLDYYPRFLQQFPSLASLAAALFEAVLALWSGLGYYSRARNLHRCAQHVQNHLGGQFPRVLQEARGQITRERSMFKCSR